MWMILFRGEGDVGTAVPPSILATALQTYDRVSDEEASERASFDLRWKLALGVALQGALCQEHLAAVGAQILVHDLGRMAFERSLKLAPKRGHLK